MQAATTDGTTTKEQCVSPGSQAYVQETNSGSIKTFVGPCPCDPGTNERPVNYDPQRRIFTPAGDLAHATSACFQANQGSYLVLSNPVITTDNLTVEQILGLQPSEGGGKPMVGKLDYGKDLILPGPVMLPVWPGQHGRLVKGHSLLSNEFLTVRITDPVLAQKYWEEIVTEKAEGEPAADNEKKVGDAGIGKARKFRMGELLIVQGDKYSFFIPCHGAEVVPWYTKDDVDKKRPLYIRPACTLQNLQYCILQDENGTEDYVYGPEVVFPKPTERFWTDANGRRKFDYVELIDKHCGIHLKVVSEFTEEGENGETHGVGDELWITGEHTPIFKPRKELRCIEYGEGNQLHFGTLVPEDQGRYVLDKDTGTISVENGGTIIICDPRNKTIVRRPLTDQQCDDWYPGNEKVKAYNRKLREAGSEGGQSVSEAAWAGQAPGRKRSSHAVRQMSANLPSMPTKGLETFSAGLTRDTSDALGRPEGATNWEDQQYLDAEAEATEVESTGGAGSVPGSFKRRSKHTEPRSITIGGGDDPYAGVPKILPWSKNAVQIVKANGDRETRLDGKAIKMGFTDVLQPLQLSQDTPKGVQLVKKRTCYLIYENNRVKDKFEVITADGVVVTITVDYRIDFDVDQKEKWFDVIDYVELAYVRMRSVLTTRIRKVDIEEFYRNGQEMIRDFVLGEPGATKVGEPFTGNPEGPDAESLKRPGFPFPDNGMCITDCDVQPLVLDDEDLQKQLDDLQQQVIESNVAIASSQKELSATKQLEDLQRQLLAEKEKTAEAEHKVALAAVDRQLQQLVAAIKQDQDQAFAKLDVEKANQAIADVSAKSELLREAAKDEQNLAVQQAQHNLALALIKAETTAKVEASKAIKDGLGEIAATLSDARTVEILSKAFDVQGGLSSIVSALKGDGAEGVFGMIQSALGEVGGDTLQALKEGMDRRTAKHAIPTSRNEQ